MVIEYSDLFMSDMEIIYEDFRRPKNFWNRVISGIQLNSLRQTKCSGKHVGKCFVQNTTGSARPIPFGMSEQSMTITIGQSVCDIGNIRVQVFVFRKFLRHMPIRFFQRTVISAHCPGKIFVEIAMQILGKLRIG